MARLDDYSEPNDSLNLKTIDGQPFTIIDWERSDFQPMGEESKIGIKFTTDEKFDGGLQKLHTTRQIVIQKFFTIKDGVVFSTKLGKAVKDENDPQKFTVRCILKKSTKENGNDYYDLVDSEVPRTQELKL
tara:strand:+ start:2839 stop:3231 length:393 start_codon:yes stop_codon:yes gene_type:complete